MTLWKKILADSITSYSELKHEFGSVIDPAVQQVIAQFPMRINPYFISLIKKYGNPLFLQAVPSPKECQDNVCLADPLKEEHLSPVPNLVHKYPDRVLMLVSRECAMYCRFCTRKRKVGTARLRIDSRTIKAGIDYLYRHPAIKDVLISGGDPLLLDTDVLDEILTAIRAVPTVETIRIGTRIPCTLPIRVNEQLCSMLKKHHPLFINTHFNHPYELTPEAQKACSMLADAGIPLGCQTVLLKGINDSPEVMRTLMRELLRLRVKPYYLFQADLTRGTNHFRTSTQTGLTIMRHLIGHLSGMAVPTYALDAPEGKGKIPLTPDYVTKRGDVLEFLNYKGEKSSYPEA